MSQAQKSEWIKNMRQDVERAAGVLFVDYTGLSVAEVNSFRKLLRQSNVGYKVVKNTLMRQVVHGTAFAAVESCLRSTPTGVVLGYEDPVAAAKLTFEFIKGCDKISVKGGIVEASPLSAQEAEALAKMPGRRELQAGIVAQAMGPGSKIAGQLKSPSGRIVGAIEALVKRLES